MPVRVFFGSPEIAIAYSSTISYSIAPSMNFMSSVKSRSYEEIVFPPKFPRRRSALKILFISFELDEIMIYGVIII